MIIQYSHYLSYCIDFLKINVFSASVSALATPLGTILTGFFTDRIGRKKTMILVKLLSILTWLVAILLKNPVFFYGSSVLGGLTRGGEYEAQFLYYWPEVKIYYLESIFNSTS